MYLSYYLLSLVILINLTNGVYAATRKNHSKKNHKMAHTREFQKMNLSNEEIKFIRSLKNQDYLNSLLGDDNESTNAHARKIGLWIFPGTHWCGSENIADSTADSDLGKFDTLDKCCRTHDHCPRFLTAGQSGYGTVNNGKYTASDCECDEEFRDCLRAVETDDYRQNLAAKTVGKIFYNWLEMKCLEFNDEPAVDGETSDTKKAVLKEPTSFK